MCLSQTAQVFSDIYTHMVCVYVLMDFVYPFIYHNAWVFIKASDAAVVSHGLLFYRG